MLTPNEVDQRGEEGGKVPPEGASVYPGNQADRGDHQWGPGRMLLLPGRAESSIDLC